MKFTLIALLAATATAAPVAQRRGGGYRGGYRGGPGLGLGGLGVLVGDTLGSGAAAVGDLLVGGTVGTLNALGNAAGSFTNGILNGLAPRPAPVVVVPAGAPYPYAQPYRGWYKEDGEEAAAPKEESAPKEE